jgi:hypothetical protein
MPKAKSKAKSKAKGRRVPAFCKPVSLPDDLLIPAAQVAWDVNPANAPAQFVSAGAAPMEPMALAVLTSKYWGAGGVRLTVGFMDNPPAALRSRLLLHFNAWGEKANVKFVESNTSPQVRVARGQDGYWSYLGTDILSIPRNRPTMNLAGFTERTSEGEFLRVVRHEVGHTLGFPHEHLRRELVARIDPAKAVAYFRRTSGWSEAMTRSNVLTPLEDRSIMGTPAADEVSVMAYQLPGAIMRDGRPIAGGNDINPSDHAFAAKIYPLADVPPPPPTGSGLPAVLVALDAAGNEVGRYRVSAGAAV